MRCGYLVVPEDRARPDDRTIQLFVAIIPAQSGNSAPDPVVYMGSGPGGIAIFEAPGLVTAGVDRDRDLIVVNQRGQFLSIPALTCPEIDEFSRHLLSLRFYSPSTKHEHLHATAACHRALVATSARPILLQLNRERGRFRRSPHRTRHFPVERCWCVLR